MAVMEEDAGRKRLLSRLGQRLDDQAAARIGVAPYDEGGCPIPAAIVRARVTRAYRALMPTAEAPWGSLVVDSVQDRLEVAGIRDSDDSTADRVWEVWQANSMDSESKLAHRSTLLDGRAFAMVWPGDDAEPEISLDGSDQMTVQYREGSRRHRVAALRRWTDDDKRAHATLYTPDWIFKYSAAGTDAGSASVGTQWFRREGEWAIENPYGVVPVVELAVNRRLMAGSFGYARGEFAHCTGLIDRINLLTFLGLVVAFWMGFPIRAVVGDRILRDDDDNPVAPFASRADEVAQFEDPQTKFAEFPAADRKNLSVFAELDQLAVITKTPRHYFPLEQGMSNISADAIRASEGGLHAKVTGHKASLGEGWEEVLRLAGAMSPAPVELSRLAELSWKDHESRSLAERADAATKLASIDGVPWQFVAEKALNVTSTELVRLEALRASDIMGQLLEAAQAPVAAEANGGVPAG